MELKNSVFNFKFQSYACLPGLNGTDGYEMTISTRTSIPLDTDLYRADQEAALTFKIIVDAIMSGDLK